MTQSQSKKDGEAISRRALLAAAVVGSSAALLAEPQEAVAETASREQAVANLEVTPKSQADVRFELSKGRAIRPATPQDPALGQLSNLPGTWQNVGDFAGHGWNLIALPYKQPGKTVQPDTSDQKSPFRLLLNQFNETLLFNIVDEHVPNRGAAAAAVFDSDEHVAALEYHQRIDQIAAGDFPPTDDIADTPKGAAPIHREPGLFLNIPALGPGQSPQIARLGTIPHGDSLLALGASSSASGPPDFSQFEKTFSTLPIGVDQDVDKNPYLLPYKTFRDVPFRSIFNPLKPLDLLSNAIKNMKIKNTTTLSFDTDISTGGISNIPFVVKQANATSMKAVFFVEELEQPDIFGRTQFLLQYIQRVLLDFFPAPGSNNELIKWPHISVNTMVLAGPPSPPVA